MNNITETHLHPIKKQKFTNIALFDRRERENQNIPIQLSKVKSRQSKALASFYITEKRFQKTETDKLSTLQTDALTYQTLSTEPIMSNKHNLLKLFEANTRRQYIDEQRAQKCKTQVDFKNDSLKRKKESIKDFMNKTRELILMKYTANIKQERAIRLQETYENEVESINDTIKSLKQAQSLFNETFYVKFGDYVKHLSNQREIEKAKSSNLL